ncbi:hypothetical protein QCN27_06135 [Cereibacter sp. SYSU M97828]|nr:hypothetical protein [Cereibacter flavus]
MRWLAPLLLLVACGPIPLEDAERACLRRAELAERPRGHIAIGTGSLGTYTDLEVSASSDYFMGRDPAAVYNACVYQKSGGEMPSRPLYDRPDWRG